MPQICRFAEELNLRAPIQVAIHANKLQTKTRAIVPFFRPIQILLATGPSGYLAVCTSPTPWQRRCPTSPLTTTPAPSRRQRLIGIFEHRQCLYKCLVFPSPFLAIAMCCGNLAWIVLCSQCPQMLRLNLLKMHKIFQLQ